MIKTWRIGVLATAVLTIAMLVTMPLSGAAQVGPGYSIEMSGEFLRRAGAGRVGLDSSAEVNRAYWSEPVECDSQVVRTLLTGGFPALVQKH